MASHDDTPNPVSEQMAVDEPADAPECCDTPRFTSHTVDGGANTLRVLFECDACGSRFIETYGLSMADKRRGPDSEPYEWCCEETEIRVENQTSWSGKVDETTVQTTFHCAECGRIHSHNEYTYQSTSAR